MDPSYTGKEWQEYFTGAYLSELDDANYHVESLDANAPIMHPFGEEHGTAGYMELFDTATSNSTTMPLLNSSLYDPNVIAETISPSSLSLQTEELNTTKQPQSKRSTRTKQPPTLVAKANDGDPASILQQYPVSQSLPACMEKSGGMAVQYLPTNMTSGSNLILRPLEDVGSAGSPMTFSEGSPRTTSSDSPRRDAHMASEQRRRAIMRQCFDRLERLLPPSEYRKASKANLLQAAVNYIENLQMQEKTLGARIRMLRNENAYLYQQLHGTSSPYLAGSSKSTDGNTPIAPAGHTSLMK